VLGAVALAVVDSATLASVFVVWIARKLGVEPRQIRKYDKVTGGDDG
jgi:hypothetical protein